MVLRGGKKRTRAPTSVRSDYHFCRYFQSPPEKGKEKRGKTNELGKKKEVTSLKGGERAVV